MPDLVRAAGKALSRPQISCSIDDICTGGKPGTPSPLAEFVCAEFAGAAQDQDETVRVAQAFEAIIAAAKHITSTVERHTLEIHGHHDAIARCSCGGWSLTSTGARTMAAVEEEHQRHVQSCVQWTPVEPAADIAQHLAVA
jgi:hypothetical protein